MRYPWVTLWRLRTYGSSRLNHTVNLEISIRCSSMLSLYLNSLMRYIYEIQSLFQFEIATIRGWLVPIYQHNIEKHNPTGSLAIGVLDSRSSIRQSFQLAELSKHWDFQTDWQTSCKQGWISQGTTQMQQRLVVSGGEILATSFHFLSTTDM